MRIANTHGPDEAREEHGEVRLVAPCRWDRVQIQFLRPHFVTIPFLQQHRAVFADALHHTRQAAPGVARRGCARMAHAVLGRPPVPGRLPQVWLGCHKARRIVLPLFLFNTSSNRPCARPRGLQPLARKAGGRSNIPRLMGATGFGSAPKRRRVADVGRPGPGGCAGRPNSCRISSPKRARQASGLVTGGL